MANWVWLNIPLGAVIFLAVAGIPLWLVIKHPDTGPYAGAANRMVPARARAARAAAGSAARRPEAARGQRLSPAMEAAGGTRASA